MIAKGRQWPPRTLADVDTQARAACAWALARRDVTALSVALGALPPNDRPVLAVSFLFDGADGRRYRMAVRFECARGVSGGTARWVKAVLTRKVRDFNRGLKAKAAALAAEGGAR